MFTDFVSSLDDEQFERFMALCAAVRAHKDALTDQYTRCTKCGARHRMTDRKGLGLCLECVERELNVIMAPLAAMERLMVSAP